MKVKLIRRPQTISPFGVGAILDVEGESLVATDITRWKDSGDPIREPRLEKLLGVSKFKMGPAAPDRPWESSRSAPGLPFYRFPQWLFCPRCRRMTRWSISHEQGEAPLCAMCIPVSRSKLVPMRFVMACPRGHLADVPWGPWAHSKNQGKCEKAELEFITRPGGSGLEFVFVRCRTCKAERSLEGIASPDSLKALKVKCPGRQPWQAGKEEKSCDAIPQVLQRGATNLTFSVVVSSIDIPPYSRWSVFSADNLLITSMPEFAVIKSSPTHPFASELIKMIARKVNIDEERVQQIINAELQVQGMKTVEKDACSNAENDLLSGEFAAFLSPDGEEDPRDRFIKRRIPLESYLASIMAEVSYKEAVIWVGNQVDALVQVTKLREVRVLRGFSRLSPVVGEDEEGEGPGTFSVYNSLKKVVPTMVPSDLDGLAHTEKWLPAIEVFGEGVFLSLNEISIQKWEASSSVQERVEPLRNRRGLSGGFLPIPSVNHVCQVGLSHFT